MLFDLSGRMALRSIMALIRGVGSLFPCPRCLISEVKQGDPSASAPLRTAADTRATILEARGKQLVGEKEDVLKAAGLRDVDVRPFSYYNRFTLRLNTSSIECILEDLQLGPTHCVIFRSTPYPPRRYVSASPLGSAPNTPRAIG